MLIMMFRAAILYLLVVVALRLMGKRQLGELQPSELVVTILVSNIASIPMEDLTLPMMAGILPIVVLVTLELVMATFSMRFPKFRRLLSGNPVVVIRNGNIDQKALASLRYSIDDLMDGLRGQGYFDPREVYFAMVETTGTLSILPKFQSQQVNAGMMKLKGKDKNPPSILVSEGKICGEDHFKSPWTLQKLERILRADQISPAEVYLFLADDSGSYTVIRKEKKA